MTFNKTSMKAGFRLELILQISIVNVDVNREKFTKANKITC